MPILNTKMPLLYLVEDWEEMGDKNQRPAGVAVAVKHKDGSSIFAWSPDGRGAYYYDTYAELAYEHGEVLW